MYRPVETNYSHEYERDVIYSDEQQKDIFIDPFKTTVVFVQGNKGCIPLDEFVYTENGLVQIQEIRDGTRLLNGYVKEPYYFEDEVYEIKIDGVKHRFSGEHPIWVMKSYMGRCKNKFGGWVMVKEIYDHYQREGLKNKWHVQRYDAKYFTIKTESIGKPLARLLGYIMSDGTFGKKQTVRFSNTNQNFLDDFIKLSLELKEQFSFQLSNYREGNVQNICLVHKKGHYRSYLKEKFYQLGIMNRNTLGKLQILPEDELIEFLQSFFNGDGCLMLHQGYPRISFSTGIHKRIALEIQFMLWRLGIDSIIVYQKHKPTHMGFYEVKINESESMKKLIMILDETKYPKKFFIAKNELKTIKRTSEHHKIWFGQLLPITDIKKIGKEKVCGWETYPTGEIIGYCGLRTHNSGKSSLDEYMATENYEAGHTVIDVLSADNYESLFYHINLDCKKYWEEKAKTTNEAMPKYHCNCEKRYKILILVPDYVQIDQEALDGKMVNHKYWSKTEWKEKYPDSLEFPSILRCKNCEREILNKNTENWSCNNCGSKETIRTPPVHPEYREWVKVKKITIPNKGFKNRDKFVEQLTDALLTGRDERRIVTLNAVFIKDKNHKYRLLEQLIREINLITRIHFQPHDRFSVAKKRGVDKPIPYSQWTPEEKNFHRVTIVLREFGSVAPAGLKGEAQETIVKKALLNSIRLVRNFRITVIADFQRHADVIPSIRDQRDIFIFKRTNQDMFPMDNYKWLYDEVRETNYQRAKEIGQIFADKYYPTIDRLRPDQMLVLFDEITRNGKRWKILKAKQPRFHHRQENDEYEKITNIAYEKTWRWVTQNENGETIETIKNEQMEDRKIQETMQQKLYEIVVKMQNPIDPAKKKMTYDEIYEHCKTLNLIPNHWKGVSTLRKFMSDYRKKLTKTPTQTS